jgi:hypothetical protein
VNFQENICSLYMCVNQYKIAQGPTNAELSSRANGKKIKK